MILDLHRQGLGVSAIARRTGLDRKTVRKYIESGLEPPAYKPRQPRALLIDGFAPYLRERLASYPELSGRRLWREVRELGFKGGYTSVTGFLHDIRPAPAPVFERRFETPAGRQAQVDFAQFRTEFADDPGQVRIVWLFSMVLGHSRLIWGRFVAHQDLQTVLRCHVAAFEAMGGVPSEVLYDRMRTAVTGEDAEGVVVFNKSLVELGRHYGFLPKACRPYRAKTKGKVERPFRYIREDFSWPAASATSTISTRSSGNGWTALPTRGGTPPRSASCPSTSPTSARTCSRCRQARSRRCCVWTGGSPARAWFR